MRPSCSDPVLREATRWVRAIVAISGHGREAPEEAGRLKVAERAVDIHADPHLRHAVERIEMYVAEFTLHPKPGHYAEVAELYSRFGEEFLAKRPELETVLILGDEGSGVVRGIGVFTDRPAADGVNSDPDFAAFNDAVAPMLAAAPERVELALLHLFTRA